MHTTDIVIKVGGLIYRGWAVVFLADSWEKYVAFAGGVAKMTTYGAAEARLTPWVSSEWLDGLGYDMRNKVAWS